MSTKQKLTLGIAAIFMVTLTIVGVTYAYFVTRVTGETTESINISTANVGSVEYQPGNGSSDVVTLADVLPGTTLYKSFKVHNTSEDTASNFSIFMTSTPTASTPQFVHAKDDSGCYVSTVKPSNDGEATATCFDGTAYNNVYVTLYEVDDTEFATVQNDGTITSPDVLTDVITAETRVAAIAGTGTTQATQDLKTDISIDGNATKYYVLKVEYKNTGSNQNIENDAALSLKASIK